MARYELTNYTAEMTIQSYTNFTKEELIEILLGRDLDVEQNAHKKKYGLIWEEKHELFDIDSVGKIPVLAKVTKNCVLQDSEQSNHILIRGDNYHALKVLSYTHERSVDLIYIDPPYNTGNSDFRYNDKYVDREDGYRHSKWLSFMSKRIKLAKTLLKDTGVLFVSLDENEFAQFKLLGDEIFGADNYICDIIWNSRKSVSNDALISLNHNHTLVFAKSLPTLKKTALFRVPIKPETFENLDNDKRGPWKADPFDAPNIRPNLTYAIKNPKTGVSYMPAKGRCWRTTETEYKKLLADNRIVFGKHGNTKPQLKRFLAEAELNGSTPKSIWDDVGTTTDGTKELADIIGQGKFNNPKPVSLLKKIVQLASPENGVVLDFFAGSGTTAQAVMELNTSTGSNRQCILVTNDEGTFFKDDGQKLPDGICANVTLPRLKKIIQGYTTEKGVSVEKLKGNLVFYTTEFIEDKNTSKTLKDLAQRSAEMLCMKENCFFPVQTTQNWSLFSNSRNKNLLLVFDEFSAELLRPLLLGLTQETIVYVYQVEDDDDLEKEYKGPGLDHVKVKQIPKGLLALNRRLRAKE